MILVDVANGKQRHVPYRDSKLTFLLQVCYRCYCWSGHQETEIDTFHSGSLEISINKMLIRWMVPFGLAGFSRRKLKDYHHSHREPVELVCTKSYSQVYFIHFHDFPRIQRAKKGTS